MVLLGGCRPQCSSPPSSAPTVTTANKPPLNSAPVSIRDLTNSATAVSIGRLTDDFNLPLVIDIEKMEVPPEIQGPSPPIKEEPASP